MDKGIVTKEKLTALFASISKEKDIFAPFPGREGMEYRPMVSGKGLDFTYANTRLSAKGALFPQREVLLSFQGTEQKAAPTPDKDIILFGLRPCDAKAFTFLDTVFGMDAAAEGTSAGKGNPLYRKFLDPYYVERRKRSLIISLACNEPPFACFCTSVGGSPFGEDGADIVAVELENTKADSGKLLFKARTEKGKAFLESHKAVFVSPTDTDISMKKSLEEKAVGALKVLPISDVKKKLDETFDDEAWEAVTVNCLGCGVCTFVCPTCHCFDITDETANNGSGVRLRTWDSCQYPLFTKHASGHNPRVDKKQRMRQRTMHKFSYTVETAGMVSCVGCGRCVRYCPVNLDIRESVLAFSKI